MKYRVNKGFIVQKIGDKTVIFDGEESVLYTLNQTASEIFRWLKKGLSRNEVINKMKKRYGVKKDKLEKDLDDLIKNLKKKKIIRLWSR